MNSDTAGTGTKTYSLYLSPFFKILIFGYLGAMTLIMIGFALPIAFIPSDDAGLPISKGISMLFLLSIAVWLWYWILSTPHKIVFEEDGIITFISVLRRKSLPASNIQSIKPECGQIGFFVVRSSRGKVRILNQFDEFHEFITTLRKINPTVTIRGC